MLKLRLQLQIASSADSMFAESRSECRTVMIISRRRCFLAESVYGCPTVNRGQPRSTLHQETFEMDAVDRLLTDRNNQNRCPT